MLRANTQGMPMQSKNSFHLPKTSIEELPCSVSDSRTDGSRERESVKISDASLQALASLCTAGTECLTKVT